jgi:hypothetical protein
MLQTCWGGQCLLPSYEALHFPLINHANPNHTRYNPDHKRYPILLKQEMPILLKQDMPIPII